MTQEEKQLLLKDLCARLPYRVRVKISDKDILLVENNEKGTLDGKETISDDNFVIKCDKNSWIISCDGFKPYLRSMSSMTEDERNFLKEQEWAIAVSTSGTVETTTEGFDWLNEHHFDYRIDPFTGKTLIESGLALKALEGMYKTE